jgi:hypothetical protein
VEAKFLGNAVLALSPERAARIVQAVGGLAGDAPLAELMAALRP